MYLMASTKVKLPTIKQLRGCRVFYTTDEDGLTTMHLNTSNPADFQVVETALTSGKVIFQKLEINQL